MNEIRFAEVAWHDRRFRLEYRLILPERRDSPLLVFLHEGLGSVAMWKDFPDRLCEAAGVRGLVYSRPGYGGSTPREPDERWQADYMHRQATQVLPAFLKALSVSEPVWLFGHSDGGSIALIHAASFPASTRGIIVVAPHTHVEEFGLASIRAAREAYATTDLREKLARYHADVDSAFRGWNDIWLDPAFKEFDLRSLLPTIECPVMAVQGLDDEYGTLEQIDGIARALPGTCMLKFPRCGHSPHRDAPTALIEEVSRFIAQTPSSRA